MRELKERGITYTSGEELFWDPILGLPIKPDSLDNSSHRGVRFFAKDRIHFLYVLLLLAVCLVAWRMFRPAPYRVLYSTAAGTPAWANPANPGFTVHKRSVQIDLRHEEPVPNELRDKIRLSPSVHDYTLIIEKDESNPRFLVYEIISQRQLNEVFCTSPHPYEVRYRKQDEIAGSGLDNVWTILIDTSQHLPHTPFTVSFRLVRYNAYQAMNRNWVGVKVDDHEDLVVTRVLLPENRQLQGSPDVSVRKRDSKEEAPYTGTSTMVPSDDHRSFEWTLPAPAPQFIYKAYIDWGS
jgi:hypothetical protein